MADLQIIPVTAEHSDALASLARRTFEQAFASGNDPQDLAAYLDQAFTSAKMREEVSCADSQFYFAILDGTPAGYLKLNTGEAQTEQMPDSALEIERIYVDAAHHGTGVGKKLFDFAVEFAAQHGCDQVWLGVWEENPKAIAFYERQGFISFGKHEFTIGNDVQTDILMRYDVP